MRPRPFCTGLAAAGRWTAVGLLTAVLVGCPGGPGAPVLSSPQMLIVGASGAADYASIQAAVTAAPPGSTIQIEAGTYSEIVYVGKRLTIIGSGPGTIVEFPAGGVPDSAVIEIRDIAGAACR